MCSHSTRRALVCQHALTRVEAATQRLIANTLTLVQQLGGAPDDI